MKIIYKNEKLKEICEDEKTALKFFGGNIKYVDSLRIRIMFILNSSTLNDIVKLPSFRFHKLLNKGKNKNYDGFYAIDLRNKSDRWRIIIQPLDDNYNPPITKDIIQISSTIRILKIEEVTDYHG